MTLRVPVLRLLRGFLVLPMLIVLGFVALAYMVDWLDNNAGPRHAWGPLRIWLSQYVGDTESAIGMLSAIAGSLFTVTSITFSILLLAVQQGAAVLNAQVVDHYLARASNRAWLGFFVGVSVFVLITLVQTTHTKAPVLGVLVSALMGALSLLALVVLIRSTIDQTRPVIVIAAILEAAHRAREREAPFLAASAEPDPTDQGGETVHAAAAGRLLRPDPGALASLLADAPGVRLTVAVAVGDFVATGGRLAVLHGPSTPMVVDGVRALLPLSGQRDVTSDAGASLDHLATIGWTAISTAKSDPDVGAEVLNALHDLLRRWAPPAARADPQTSAIRYHDAVPGRLLDALESAIVAAGESRQHQSLARVLRAAADTLPLWQPVWCARAAGITDLVGRTLRDHQPTRMLADAVGRWGAALDACGETTAAERLRTAAEEAWALPATAA